MLQFKDLAVIFLIFFYMHIFVKKNPELVRKTFFINGEKQLKKHFVDISFSVFEGAPFEICHVIVFFIVFF